MAGTIVGLTAGAQGAAALSVVPAEFVGEFHAAKGPRPGPGPALLVLGGSEGGLQASAAFAQLLSDHGFNALALAYFKAPGLPAGLENIPLEYFQCAIDWLAVQPTIDAKRIGVVGASKGAEAALLIASYDPRLRAVVAAAPSSVAWAGIGAANPASTLPSWTYRGAAVPFAPYDTSGPFVSVLDLYERSLAKAPPEAAIRAERINGPVLLISGGEDRLSPSMPMAKAVMARLDGAGFGYPHCHLAYEHAGHLVFGPPLPPDSPNLFRLASLGGTVEGNQAARTDAWPKVLKFLDAALKPRAS